MAVNLSNGLFVASEWYNKQVTAEHVHLRASACVLEMLINHFH